MRSPHKWHTERACLPPSLLFCPGLVCYASLCTANLSKASSKDELSLMGSARALAMSRGNRHSLPQSRGVR